MVKIKIFWEKRQFFELMTKKGHHNFSEIFLEIFRLKSKISVTGSMTPRLWTRLMPLCHMGSIQWSWPCLMKIHREVCHLVVLLRRPMVIAVIY